MDKDELIDNYLKGHLDKTEELSFLQKMEGDETLRKEVTLRKWVIEGINIAHEEDLKKKLTEFDKSIDAKRKRTQTWYIAACISAVVVTISMFLWSAKPNPKDFDITEIGLPVVMGVNDHVDFNNAMSAFKAGDYEKSSNLFEKLLIASPTNDTLLYFSAISFYRTDKVDFAIERFKKIDSGTYLEKARYRLAIAFWTQGGRDQAITLLKEISNNESSRLKNEADKVLEAMN